jgi:hypothetical protein
MRVTLFQFVENLSDKPAAEAVRSHTEWKYALSLELEDEGFDASIPMSCGSKRNIHPKPTTKIQTQAKIHRRYIFYS